MDFSIYGMNVTVNHKTTEWKDGDWIYKASRKIHFCMEFYISRYVTCGFKDNYVLLLAMKWRYCSTA
jgi:hypothetical protein